MAAAAVAVFFIFYSLITRAPPPCSRSQQPVTRPIIKWTYISVGDVSADATGIQLLPFPVNHFFPRSLSREWVCIWARVARISREIRIIIMCNIYYAILFLWAAALQKYCCGCLPLLWYSVWFKFDGLCSLSANTTHGFYFALFPTANLDASRSGFFFGDEYLSQWPSISKINSFLWLTHFNYRIKVFQWYQK